MKPCEVLKQYKGKRLIVENNDSSYIKILAINSIEADEYLGKIPMWLRNQIPEGFSCIEVQERAQVEPLLEDELKLIRQIQERRRASEKLSKSRTHENRLVLAASLGIGLAGGMGHYRRLKCR